MIVTVTPNPSLDRTVALDVLRPGEVLRTAEATVEAAGKGVNVARALIANGHDAVAIAPCGGASGDLFLELLKTGAVAVVPVPGAGVRSNISVIEADGRTTKLNEPGFKLDAEQLKQLQVTASETALTGSWVAACGSLPPGTSPSFYADLAAFLGPAFELAVDTSGAALEQMVGVPCALLKPNRQELAQMVNSEIATVGEALSGAQKLVASGARQVLVSLGSDGALLVTADSALHGTAPTSEVRNTVGAGDSMLAGFLAGGGEGPDALTSALAWARAAIRTETTMMSTPTPEDTAAITISDALAEPEVRAWALEDRS